MTSTMTTDSPMTTEAVVADLQSKLAWSTPREVPTKFGPRMLSKADATEWFWEMWRAHKEALKKLGISVGKDLQSNAWEVCWWREIPKEVAEKRTRAVEASRATDAEVDIPCPTGLAYMPFQRAGIAFALERKSTLIADEMGLGKTIQAIGFVNAHPEFKDVLVITKAGLKLNWWRELRKWLVNPELRDSIGIADGKTLPTTRVVVLNYDIAHKFPNRINRDWDCVILDEAHQIKTPRSRRAKAIAGYKPKKDEDPALASSGIPAKYKLALTGTPIENNIAEMWTVLWWLDRAEFKSKWKLLGMAGQRYVDGAVTDATGKGMNRLQVFLREKIMVRRLKSQVLKELPPKTRTIIEFDPSGMEGLLERERELWGDDEEMADAQAALELAKAEEGEDAYKAALKRLRELQGVKFEEMAAIRRDTSVAKIPKTIEYLEGLIEDGCGKLLVFAHHIEALESFHRHFGTKSVIAHGGHNQEGKDAAVHRFMNDPGCQLFFGSTRAIGEGFTLTAASTVIFHEFDWVPSRMMQAEDRVHRIGQTENVQVHLCVVNGAMDAKMAKACKAKADIADAVLDNEVKAAIASEPVGPIDWTPLTPRGRKEIEKEAPTLTQDQIAAIGLGLMQLATVCDGARVLDGHGFNKIDSRIGKELAMVASGRGLTPRQGVLGLRLVNKYRRQLPAEIVDRALPNKVEAVEQND